MRKFIMAGILAIAGCSEGDVSHLEINQTPTSAIQVMIVGSYHMAGSNSDLVNLEADNVLTDRRQQELATLVDALAEFEPTAIAVERITAAPDYIDPNFAEFTEADLAENQNERAQIAYRLAKRAGVTRVYGIDEQPSEGEPDYFPFDKVASHAEATGQSEKLEALFVVTKAMLETFAEGADKSIAERLYEVNTGPMSAPDFYYALSALDVGEDQPGAELQAYWFMRNAKIWSKLMDVAQPGDRIVVVYGAGHKYWLEHMADHTEGYVRVDPAPYLEKAATP